MNALFLIPHMFHWADTLYVDWGSFLIIFPKTTVYRVTWFSNPPGTSDLKKGYTVAMNSHAAVLHCDITTVPSVLLRDLMCGKKSCSTPFDQHNLDTLSRMDQRVQAVCVMFVSGISQHKSRAR